MRIWPRRAASDSSRKESDQRKLFAPLGIPQADKAHDSGSAQLTGDEGIRALSYALSRINHVGATKKVVAQGLALVEEHGGTEALMEKAARVAPGKGGEASAPIMLYPEPMRVALELASRELRERHGLENEIAILRHEWREAEEIAAISERLLS